MGAVLITKTCNSNANPSSERSGDSPQVTQLFRLSRKQLWSPGKNVPWTSSQTTPGHASSDSHQVYLHLHRLSPRLPALLTALCAPLGETNLAQLSLPPAQGGECEAGGVCSLSPRGSPESRAVAPFLLVAAGDPPSVCLPWE